MSFWESEMGEITGNASDAFAKSFKQILDGTMALAKIDSFSNAEYQGNKYLTIDWLLINGEFEGQKVQQKLKVFDEDPKIRHRALNMFKLLYNMFHMKPKHANEPTDQDLYIFFDKVAGINIRETPPNDKGKQYNWVSEIHDSKGFICKTGSGLAVSSKPTVSIYEVSKHDAIDSAFSRNRTAEKEFNDDIPF